MRTRNLLLPALALALPVADAGAQGLNPPADPVAWWSGDGHFFDLAGTNQGMAMGEVSFAPGKAGRAFGFVTTNDWVRLPHDPAIFAQTVGTVEFWVRILSLQEETVRLFSASEAGVAYPSAGTWAVDYRYGGSASGAIQVNLVAGGSIMMSAFTPAGTIADTNWHHIAVVADAVDPIQVYVDGAAQVLTGVFGSTADRFFGHAPNASVMAIGAIVRESVYAEGGKQIDELAIFDRALSPNEIAAIYTAGSAGKCKPPFRPPSGLMSWWPAEGHSFDLLGTNHGTSVGAVGYAPGKVGQAFDFNGVNAYLVMPPILTNAAAFSFEWWMQVRRFTHPSYTPAFCQPYESQSPACIPGEYWFYAGNETSYGSFRFTALWRDSVNCDVHSVIPFAAGTWEHVAVIYDGDWAKIYWNGQLHLQQAHAGKTLGNLTPFWVGKAFTPHTDGQHETAFLDALMDEVSVYSRALSSHEVAAIYGAGSAGKLAPPTLSVTATNGGVLLSWPAVHGAFGLVSRPDLAPGTWETVTNAPSLNGTRQEVVLPASNAQRFFRLKFGN